MKTITVNVSEPVYRAFQEHAKRQDRTTSEIIRQAMEEFHKQHLQRSGTLRNRRAFSAGGPIKPIQREDDLLGEMLNDSRD